MTFDFDSIDESIPPEYPKKPVERTKEENLLFFNQLGYKRPWLNITEELINDEGLDSDEQKCLALISFKTNKDYKFYGSAGYIAWVLNLSISKVKKMLYSLRDRRYINIVNVNSRRRELSTRTDYCQNHTMDLPEPDNKLWDIDQSELPF